MTTPFFAGGNFATQINPGDTSATSSAVSTTATNAVMLVLVVSTADGTDLPTDMSVASVTGAGLTFQHYETSSIATADYAQTTIGGPGYFNGTGTLAIEVWWAPAPSIITSQTYTVTMTDPVVRGGFCGQPLYGVSNPSSPWVSSASLPLLFNVAQGDWSMSPVSAPANSLLLVFFGSVIDPVGPAPPVPDPPDAFFDISPEVDAGGDAQISQSGTQDPDFAPSFAAEIVGWDETSGVTNAVISQTTFTAPPSNAIVAVVGAMTGGGASIAATISEAGTAVDTTNEFHSIFVGRATEIGTAVDTSNQSSASLVGRVVETGSALDSTSGSEVAPNALFAMGTLRVIETEAGIGPEEYFVPVPFAKDYAMVWMDSFLLSPDFNYEIPVQRIGWDAWAWDSNPYDLSIFTGILDIFNPINGPIVVTVATAQAAREQVMWKVVTNTPAFLRMTPALHDGTQLVGEAMHNPTGDFPLYHVRYEYLAQSPFFAGTLTTSLSPTHTNINIQLFLKNQSWKLQDPNPLTNPSSRLQFENYPEDETTVTSETPGIIWINGERIEYFKLIRSGPPPANAPDGFPGSMVTLSGLRRGTRGTAIAEQRIVETGIGAGVPQTFTIDTRNGVGTVEMRIDEKIFTDFTITQLQVNLIGVNFIAPLDSYVTVAMSQGFTYAAGTEVYNGSNRFYIPAPTGIKAGDREVPPFNQLTGN